MASKHSLNASCQWLDLEVQRLLKRSLTPSTLYSSVHIRIGYISKGNTDGARQGWRRGSGLAFKLSIGSLHWYFIHA
jgi:hypothetical protein